MFNILETKNKWRAPPMRYYGNLNVYFLELMGTNAVALSVLVTKGHRFSLIHNILLFDQKLNLTHIKSTYFLNIPRTCHMTTHRKPLYVARGIRISHRVHINNFSGVYNQ